MQHTAFAKIFRCLFVFAMMVSALLGSGAVAAETSAPAWKTQNHLLGFTHAYPYGFFLTINGRAYADLWSYSPRIVYVFQWEGRGDVVLIRHWSGGASCCSSYQLLLFRAEFPEKKPITFPEFGRHGRDPSHFRMSRESVSFRLVRNSPASIDYVEYTFDGREISEKIVWENELGAMPRGAGDDVQRLIQLHPSNIFDDPGERLRFQKVMSADEMDQLRARLQVSSKGELVDGFYVANGCMPRQCSDKHGFLAVEISTGRPYAAFTDDLKNDGALTVFGVENEASLPKPIIALKARLVAHLTED